MAFGQVENVPAQENIIDRPAMANLETGAPGFPQKSFGKRKPKLPAAG